MEEKQVSIFHTEWDRNNRKAFGIDKDKNIYSFVDDDFLYFADQEVKKAIKTEIGCDGITLRMSLRKVNGKITFEKFKELVSESEKRRSKEMSEFDKFFTVKSPRFERETGNKKKNTFDFVFVDVSIPKWKEEKIDYIKKNIKKVREKVFKTIEENKRFQSFGVPINFLKLSNVVLRCDDLIEFTFELKDVEV